MSKEKTYIIDFSGYCKIKANSIEEAQNFFWHRIDQMEDTSAEITFVEEVNKNFGMKWPKVI